MIEGIDQCAWSGGAAIAAAGKHFVLRYVPYGQGCGLTKAQVLDAFAHGLDIGLVFESTQTRMLGGYSAGVADALTSRNALLTLGAPSNVVIYYAADWNLAGYNTGAINAYLRGAASVLGLARTGVYGPASVIRAVMAAGTARFFWQTVAWSGSTIVAGIHLYQYRTDSMGATPINGHGVDYDRSYIANWGQWSKPVAPPPSGANRLYFPGGYAYRYPVGMSTGPLVAAVRPPAGNYYFVTSYLSGAQYPNPWYKFSGGTYGGYYVPRGVLLPPR